MNEKEFATKVLELLRLVEGLDAATYHCACRRMLKVGISSELRVLLPELKAEALAKAGKTEEEALADTSRFGLLEID